MLDIISVVYLVIGSVEVGPGLWAPVLANPGLYSRGRYGPDYLYHVQSWRHKGMENSWARYSAGAWADCPDPGNQACLNNYPIIGNTHLLGPQYP